MQASLRLFIVVSAVLGLILPASAQDRITKSRLKEEQRIIAAHTREARKDLDRAKVDLNGGRMRTAEIVLDRTEVSLSKAGGLLEEHPVRIEKLRGLFVGEKDRVQLRASFDKLDNVYLDIEREYFTMIEELGGSTFRKARIELLKHIEGFLPDLEEVDPELAAKFSSLLEQYKRAVEAGDEEGARRIFEEMVDLVESSVETLDKIGAGIDDVLKFREVTAQNMDAMIAELSPAYQSEIQGMKAAIAGITDPMIQEQAKQLLNDYVQAILAGDMEAAAKAKAKLQELLGGTPPVTTTTTTSVPTTTPTVTTPTVTTPTVTTPSPFKTTSDGGIQIIGESGRPLYNGQSFREGENRLPQVEYTGGNGKRITKEYDVVVMIDSAAGKFDAYQENSKIWLLEIKEDPSKRRVDATVITAWQLFDGTAVASGLSISGWKAVAPSGTVLRESTGAVFTVEFAEAGVYKIIVTGTTSKGNPFEVGREYRVDDGLFF